MNYPTQAPQRRLLVACMILAIIVIALFIPQAPAHAALSSPQSPTALPISPAAIPAATFTVTTTADSGVGSLRQAILNSNAAGGSNTINFSGLSYPATITLASGLPAMTTTVSINGPGASNLAVSGSNAYRVFDTYDPITLTISGLTVRDGVVSTNNDGGGIRSNSFSATVTLNNLNVINNRVTSVTVGRGGGVFLAGGVATVTNSLFMNNVASGPMGGGGIHLFSGLLTISNTTFSGNQANNNNSGGAISNLNTGILNVNASTFYSNTAPNGGAVSLQTGNFFTNTTFVGNSATTNGAAVYLSSSNARFVNSTFYGNSGGTTLYNANVGALTVVNSIVAFPKTGVNCGGISITNGGNNIDSGTSCGWGGGSGSLSSTDPKLAQLGNYSGPTQTMALYVGSPAIDKANANCPSVDQRGVARSGAPTSCDSGAFEGAWYPLFLPLILR